MTTKTIQRKNFNIDYTIVLGYITSSNGNEWRVKQKDITKKKGDFIVYDWNIVRMKDGLVLSNAGLPRDVSAYDYNQNKSLIKDLIDNKESKQINGNMKLKKGSQKAKDFMAKVRASKEKKSLGAVKKKKQAVKRKPLATESKSLKDTLKRKKLALPHGYELRKRKLSGVNTSKFKTMAQVKRANASEGYFFFSPKTMKFFGTKIVSSLIMGKYFITSEKITYSSGKTEIEYYVREVEPEANIITLKKFATKDEAKAYLKIIH